MSELKLSRVLTEGEPRTSVKQVSPHHSLQKYLWLYLLFARALSYLLVGKMDFSALRDDNL